MYLLHRAQLPFLIDLSGLIVLLQVLVLGLLNETLEELKFIGLPIHLEKIERHAPPLNAGELFA